MRLLDIPDLFAETIFCDDIRMEVGGKVSYIGAYKGQMLVHGKFPFILPKMGFAVSVSQRPKIFIPVSKILISLPGDLEDNASIQAEVDVNKTTREAVKKAEEEALADIKNSDHRVVGFAVNLIFAPITIREPGFIKVRAVRGDTLVRCGGLFIAPASAS